MILMEAEGLEDLKESKQSGQLLKILLSQYITQEVTSK